ncbi:hypothetical protein K435DRAFT_854560 [Dendrothele bispora CBS 962.96]|uniref:Uncharacterized protein n=1 Tax=Dendrothele bispora (strain CBS 962.96) TaxID=1314807 RepID=A0A4S8MEV2_DENBC|nr:hypothetical protein K435DRAFT_854560 [Dendrothele bispora CBS 962.96]
MAYAGNIVKLTFKLHPLPILDSMDLLKLKFFVREVTGINSCLATADELKQIKKAFLSIVQRSLVQKPGSPEQQHELTKKFDPTATTYAHLDLVTKMQNIKCNVLPGYLGTIPTYLKSNSLVIIILLAITTSRIST